MPTVEVPIPHTSHVKAVMAAAEKYGLTLVKVTGRYGDEHDFSEGARVSFEKKHHRVDVTFDRRGYIRQAGGNAPDVNNWVISVSGSRRFGCSPARALDVLVNHTMPRYAEEVA